MSYITQQITRRRLFDEASDEIQFIPIETPVYQYYGILKRYVGGGTWTQTKMHVKTPYGFEDKPVRRWDGTNWVRVNVSGI